MFCFLPADQVSWQQKSKISSKTNTVIMKRHKITTCGRKKSIIPVADGVKIAEIKRVGLIKEVPEAMSNEEQRVSVMLRRFQRQKLDACAL